MQTKRIWVAKLALLIISTLLGILAMEVFLRVTERDRPLLWEPDAQLGWRHIPHARLHWVDEGDGHVIINSLGLRDPERTIQKDSGVFRIAVFGDSTTEAVQVDLEQTFTQVLEKRFQQRGLRVEVLNFGVSGYGPLQEYLLYMQYGRRFAPDLVLDAVFLDNDIADGDRRLASGQRGAPFLKDSAVGGFEIDDSLAVSSAESYHRQPLYTVRRYSAVYRVFRAARYRSLSSAVVQGGPDGSGQVPRRFLLYAEPLGREWEEAWNTFDRVITRFSDDVRRDGAAFAVVSMPAGQVVHPEVWKRLLTEYPAMASRQWDLLSAEKRLRLLADRHQIPLVAPLDRFVQASSGDPLFFRQIGHLTPHGHEIMAAALDAALTEHGLVPGNGSVSPH